MFRSAYSSASALKDIDSREKECEREVVRAAVVYPKTTSLSKDKPRVEFFDGISSGELESFIESNQTFRAYDCNSEVLGIVKLLKKYNHNLLSDQVDLIQIYKGGIDVFRIYKSEETAKKLESNDSSLDRSIYVEINSVRSKLWEEVNYRAQRFWTIISLSAIFTTCAVIMNNMTCTE